jgi:hypothetical protein
MAGPRPHHVAVIGALLLAGCRSAEPAALPAACLGEPAAIARALERAPAAVTLADGSSLSRCVSGAREDADLQALGLVLTQVADVLRMRAASEPAAALRLGYLVGAARRGAQASPGLAAQLVRRLEQIAAPGDEQPEAGSQLQRGIRAGEASG